MKTNLIALVLVLALSALSNPASARDQAAKITGPNQGRVFTALEQRAELFVTAERKLRITFLDEAGKPIATPVGASVTVTTGERAAPVILSFAPDGDALLSSTALPEGGNLPAVVRIKPGADAKPVTIRLQLNLALCGECDHPEYACACAH